MTPTITVKFYKENENIVEYTINYIEWPAGKQMADGYLTQRTFHCNREATFFGPWTGAPARQMDGGSQTVWRDDLNGVFMALRQKYPGYAVKN